MRQYESNDLRDVKSHVIYIAPKPVFSIFIGGDHWVACFMVMSGSMFILRIIAATHMSTDQTQSQVYPIISNFQTVFTSICRGEDILNGGDMQTTLYVQFVTVNCILNTASYPNTTTWVFFHILILLEREYINYNINITKWILFIMISWLKTRSFIPIQLSNKQYNRIWTGKRGMYDEKVQ